MRPRIRAASTGPAEIIDEFETYIKEPAHHEEQNEVFHPLDYWKTNAHRFKYLSEIAVEILGIPASSGQLERIFSTASDIKSAKRNRLSPVLFERLLFIKRNQHLLPHT